MRTHLGDHLKQILANDRTDHCYVIGYSFRDEDILGLFLDAFRLNPNLHLSLMDPDADRIASEKFGDFIDRVQKFNGGFSLAACSQLD